MVLGLLRPSSFGLTLFGLRRVSRERELAMLTIQLLGILSVLFS